MYSKLFKEGVNKAADFMSKQMNTKGANSQQEI